MKRSLAKLLAELNKANRAATLEETLVLVDALKAQDRRERIQALAARLKALRSA